jgi:adenylate cyclase
MRVSLRNKLFAVCFSTTVFAGLAMIFVVVAGGSIERAAFVAPTIGFATGLFEEFYVQGRRGRWLRAMHPAKSIFVYSLLIVGFSITVMMSARFFFGPANGVLATVEIFNFQSPFFIVLPAMIPVSAAAIMLLRIVGYMGARNLFHLLIGKYHRPVLEKRIFLFLDIKGSTALVERLGPVETRSLIGKLFFDTSVAITDYGGEIHRFTGDGFVAVWDWKVGITNNRIANAIDAIGGAVRNDSEYYLSRFGHVPQFRIGVNGGPIVTSEEGDTKRAIGFYGDTIHIAARLEQKAKELGVDCLLSENIAENLVDMDARLRLVGDEPIRGISETVRVYELRPADG